MWRDAGRRNVWCGVPVVEADLEDLFLRHLGDPDQVEHARDERLVALGHLQHLKAQGCGQENQTGVHHRSRLVALWLRLASLGACV